MTSFVDVVVSLFCFLCFFFLLLFLGGVLVSQLVAMTYHAEHVGVVEVISSNLKCVSICYISCTCVLIDSGQI